MLREFEVMDGRELHSNLGAIPENGGVYAWYPRLTLDDSGASAFRASITSQLTSRMTLPNLRGRIGPYSAGFFPRASELTAKKELIARELSRKPSHRPRFAYALLVASVFQPPLYVGKANNLRLRIRSHRDGATDFAQEMLKRALMPDGLIVAYVELERFPKKCNELFEYILTILSTPPFVKRPG